jgi:radical SAM protein with 4Fe4S-binding SPASM domain
LKNNFFRKTIDQLSRELIFLIFYFQGEPYLNPDFLEMVKYAHSKGLYTMTSTNAHFLTDKMAKKTVESGLDRLIISIDGTTQQVYQQYRIGGQLEKVLQGAKHIIQWKKRLKSSTPYTIFQYLVVRPNEHQINEVHQLAKEIGVDEVKFKTAQIYNYKDGHPLIPKNEKFSRYQKRRDGKYHLKYDLFNHCWKMWHASVITWDGRVVPCCFDKDAEHELGSVKEKSFKNIWTGSAYQNFRANIFKSRKKINICTNCTEGCKVWLE